MNNKNKIRKLNELLQPRHYKFFICYADEMQKDVLKLKNLLYSFAQDCNASFSIYIDEWREYLEDTHYTSKTVQDCFNEKILKSDYVIFLFHNHLGAFTMEEWRLCLNNTKKKPRILLGLKQNTRSTKTCDDKINVLGATNVVQCCKYRKIKEFVFAIMKIFQRQLNYRIKRVQKILQEYPGGLFTETSAEFNAMLKVQEQLADKILMHKSRLCLRRNFPVNRRGILMGSRNISYTNPGISCNDGLEVLQS